MDVNLVAIASVRQFQLQPKVGNCVCPSREQDRRLLPLPLTLLGGQSSKQHGNEEASQDLGHRSAFTHMLLSAVAIAKYWQLPTKSLLSPTNRNQ